MSTIDQTLGAALLGTVGSTFLLGVTLAQAYEFTKMDYKATFMLKLFVASIV
jgi:hypothetical protein